MDDLLDFEWGSGGTAKGKKTSTAQMSMLERAQAQAAQTAAASAATKAADAQLWDFDAFLSTGNSGSARAPAPTAAPVHSRPAPAAATPGVASAAAEPDIFAIFDSPVKQQQARPQEAARASTSRTAAASNKPQDVFALFESEDFPSAAAQEPKQRAPESDEDAPPLPRRTAGTIQAQARAQDSLFSFEDDEDAVRQRDEAILGGRPSPPRQPRRDPSPSSQRRPPRAGPQGPALSFEDEEEAARKRDEAILGGGDDAAPAHRRRRDGAAGTSSGGTASGAAGGLAAGWGNFSTSVASMFAASKNSEDGLVSAFSRTLGGLGDTILGAGREVGGSVEDSAPAPRASRRAAPPPASPGPQRRLPRSMVGVEQSPDGAADPARAPPASMFRDEDDGEASNAPVSQSSARSARASPAPHSAPSARRPDPVFSDPIDTAPAPRASRRAPPSQSASPAPRRRADPIRVPRTIVSDSSSAIATSASLKAQGNDAFKRGAYGEAEAHYSKALDSLEDGSLRRIPLLNNRAQARLKNGEAAGASRDCDAVLAIIVPPTRASAGGAGTSSAIVLYRPQEEAPLPEPLATEVSLRDAWAKAVLRRAQASELLERWVSARRDWDALLRFEREEGSGKAGVANMRSAKDGLQRCEEMISGKKKQPAANGAAGGGASRAATGAGRAPNNARQSASTAAAIQRAGEASVARVRAEASAKASEDAERLALKDRVDATVGGWKDGKESNVRGLLASVENVVVWPEFGWKKIGLHELITDVQVKKAYTRAIARLHPDKLTSKNYTLEQRMVAAAVFSTLNDAYTSAQS